MEDLGFGSRLMIYQLIEKEKEVFFTRGYVVGLRMLSNCSERAIYVQRRRESVRSAVKEVLSIDQRLVTEMSPIEKEDSLLSPVEIQLLVYRLCLLRNRLRQLGITIKVDNQIVRGVTKQVNNLACLSPQELEENLFLGIKKLHRNIYSPDGDDIYPNQKQGPLYHWLVSTCGVVATVYQIKTKEDFFELLRLSPGDWPLFLAGIRNIEIFGLEADCQIPNPLPDTKVPETQTFQPQAARIPISQDTPSHQEIKKTLAQRREEKLKRLDSQLDNHINQLLEQLGVRNPNKKTLFFVPQLNRTFGVYDDKVKDWEENKKYIRRSGGKSKKDKRHPSFDITEAILIGYLSGNYIQMSKEIASELREYIRKCINQLQPVST